MKTSVGCFNSPSFWRNVRNHFLYRKASFSLIFLSQAVPTCKRNAEIILCSLFCHFNFKEAFKSSSKALSLTQAKLMLCHQNYKRRKEGKGTSKYDLYDLYVKALQKLVTFLKKNWENVGFRYGSVGSGKLLKDVSDILRWTWNTGPLDRLEKVGPTFSRWSSESEHAQYVK